jgi:hypothetical protein
MKFKHPSVGDIRIIETFLWLPLRIGNETRWLETAYIKQIYTEITTPKYHRRLWLETEFVNIKTTKQYEFFKF